MLLIGERINGMYRAVGEAIRGRDEKFIRELGERQLEGGAALLDVNTGPAGGREEMIWMVTVLGGISDVRLCIDSAKADVLEAGLALCKNRPMINSTTADPEKMAFLLPMAKRYGAQIIGLTMDGRGVPADAGGRVELAAQILAAASAEYDIPAADVYIDPLLLPVNVAQDNPRNVLEALDLIRQLDVPAPNTVVGLSNISQKCSCRSLLNSTFLSMAMENGLTAAIADVLDERLVETVAAGRVILNRDIYCDSFLDAHRRSGARV